MGHKLSLSEVAETAIPAGRCDEEVEAGPGDVVAVPDPSEVRDYWAPSIRTGAASPRRRSAARPNELLGGVGSNFRI